jgi:two-component system cell cycle response regulator DivK
MTPKVLLVEDDPLMHRLYRPYLEKRGCRTTSALNGKAGMELAARDRPDVIVMDIRIPGVSGLVALREMKQQESTKGIPVIVITSFAEYQVCQNEATALGAAGFLAKPFSPGQLLAEVYRVLGQPVPNEPPIL